MEGMQGDVALIPIQFFSVSPHYRLKNLALCHHAYHRVILIQCKDLAMTCYPSFVTKLSEGIMLGFTILSMKAFLLIILRYQMT